MSEDDQTNGFQPPRPAQHRSTSIADEDVDAYLLEMSYQLRTPLSAIVGYSELLIEDPADPDEVQLLAHSIRTATRSLIDVIERLETQVMRERARRRIAELLQSLSTMMTSSLKLEDVITTVLECLDEVIEFDQATILLSVDEGEFEIGARRIGREMSWPDGETASCDTDPRLAQVTRVRGPVVVSDADVDKRTPNRPDKSDYQSWLGVPLQWAEKLVGVLALESVAKGKFDKYDAQLVHSLGTQAGLAIMNAQRYGEVHSMATHDALTSALSRRSFFERAADRLEAARTNAKPLSVLMIDLDHFKEVNDTHGHAAGDHVLLETVRRWTSRLRDDDLVGRYGGEEFLVALPGLTAKDATRVAERLRQAVANEPFDVSSELLTVTVSIGVAEYGPSVGTISQLVEEADVALYRAKRGGRNRVETAGSNLH